MKPLKHLKLALAATLVIATIAPTAAQAVQESKPLTVDGRIKTYVYVPNEVFFFTGHYRYQSTIELHPSETIESISMGDSTGWLIQDTGSRIFLKPVDPDAITNMMVYTNKRTYLFELHADEAEDIRDENLSFITRFTYPSETESFSFREFAPQQKVESRETIENNPDAYNVNYTITGSSEITPLKVFDDGEFTYIEFKGNNSPIPAAFKVDKNGNEALINYRMTDGYFVIEDTVSMITLRYGDEVACIFNEAKPMQRNDYAEDQKKVLGIF
jgi:type IV secretion system protein VirB9